MTFACAGRRIPVEFRSFINALEVAFISCAAGRVDSCRLGSPCRAVPFLNDSRTVPDCVCRKSRACNSLFLCNTCRIFPFVVLFAGVAAFRFARNIVVNKIYRRCPGGAVPCLLDLRNGVPCCVCRKCSATYYLSSRYAVRTVPLIVCRTFEAAFVSSRILVVGCRKTGKPSRAAPCLRNL